MAESVHRDTRTSDTVVELSGARKFFYQRQRSVSMKAVVRNLIHPEFKEVRALNDIDLRIGRGEIVAYAGPNGAGKSTTIKLLSGLLSPDAGTVRVLGCEPSRERAKYVRRIGVVFGQRTELWWDHPVISTFEWKQIVWDIPRDQYERTLGFVTEVLGIGEYFHSLARELSLGQRMRADLALALMHEPEILFLDEPTIGIDVLAKRNILSFIKKLNRERRMTVMLTSHDMSELEELAGRIVLIHQGEIAFDGDFEELRNRFRKHRVLVLHADSDTAPTLAGTQLVSSEAGRHEYAYDASAVKLSALLDEASAQTEILDVESHRGEIDDVIADIYESWGNG